jgi:hypothetical protein
LQGPARRVTDDRQRDHAPAGARPVERHPHPGTLQSDAAALPGNLRVVRAPAGEAESRGAVAAAASAAGIAAQIPATGDGAAALRGFSSGIHVGGLSVVEPTRTSSRSPTSRCCSRG